MKIFKNVISIFTSLAVIVILFSACGEEENYPPLELGSSNAPTISISHLADSLTESYSYLNLSSNMDGMIYYVAVSSGEVAPTAEDIILGKTSPAAQNISVKADNSYLVKLKGLKSAESFDVYGVSVNEEEGKFSSVFGPVTINCPDNTPPSVVEMTPSTGSTKISKGIKEIIIQFSEAINLIDANKISVVNAFDETPLNNIGQITVSGDILIIPITSQLDYLLDIAVIIKEGAVADVKGINCPEYYTISVNGEEVFELMFTIEDILDPSVFNGVYHCVANEIGFGNGISEYDVIIKGGKGSEGFYIDIQNIRDWTGTVVTLSVDPNVDTCFFEEQPTGNVYSGEDILIQSNDIYDLASASFKPGNFSRDGSEIKVFGQIFIAAGSFGFYEFTFTKSNSSAAIIRSNRRNIITNSDFKKYNK